MNRRNFVFLLLLVAPLLRAGTLAPSPEKAEAPALLQEAVAKVTRDFDRWAYTETRLGRDPKGQAKVDTVVRFDPSKPYAEQYTPIKINGLPPTEKQLKEYRRRGEKRGERLEQLASAGDPATHELTQVRINGDTVYADLAHARVVQEDEKVVIYEAPLRQDQKGGPPMEQVQLQARVNKEQRVFENVSLKVRDSFRVKLIAKVNSGAASVNFTTVDPKYVPVVSAISGGASASILFHKMGGTYDLKREDFVRVRPFSDRFEVKIGPMKALDF
jgi:hypothetical protein